MTALTWQLNIAGRKIAPGDLLDVVERGNDGRSIWLELRSQKQHVSEHFLVRFHVNIGGKDYLILSRPGDNDREGDVDRKTETVSGAQEPPGSEESELPIVRVLRKDCLSAMDPDRFSSLRNALDMFLEAPAEPSLDELSRLLG